MKLCRSLKWRAILKILVLFLRKTYALSVDLWNESSNRKRFPMLKQKLTQTSA